MKINHDPALTEGQAAEYLNVSVSFLQKGRCYGYGPPYTRIGQRSIRYWPSDLKEYLAANTVAPGNWSRGRK
jgi:hypothetical protein